MAILQVFAVFDSAVGAYMPPFTMKSKGEALRSFMSASQDSDHNFFKYAPDYTLFHLGSYDEASGQFTQDSPPVSLGTALELGSKDERAERPPLEIVEGN